MADNSSEVRPTSSRHYLSPTKAYERYKEERPPSRGASKRGIFGGSSFEYNDLFVLKHEEPPPTGYRDDGFSRKCKNYYLTCKNFAEENSNLCLDCHKLLLEEKNIKCKNYDICNKYAVRDGLFCFECDTLEPDRQALCANYYAGCLVTAKQRVFCALIVEIPSPLKKI